MRLPNFWPVVTACAIFPRTSYAQTWEAHKWDLKS